MLRHEIELAGVVANENGTVEVQFVLDGVPHSRVYADLTEVYTANSDLIQSPEDAVRNLLFYFLALQNGEAAALGSMVGRKLVIDVKNTLQQVTAIV